MALDPSHPEALYNLGFVAQDQGDDASAIHYFEAALASDPDFADCHFNLALALVSSERAADAASHWRRYLEIEPDGPWASVAERHLTNA